MKKTQLILIVLLISACTKSYTPRPYGYNRLSFPENSYKEINQKTPYQFQINQQATIQIDSSKGAETYWGNVVYPKLKANIHLSYKEINKNIIEILEDTRTLAYKHAVKADAINEDLIQNESKKVFGLIYTIKGNVASPIQFYLTDSTKNYIRGALYFNVPPNKDSLAPVVEYIKKDILQLIKTFYWK